jgi:hypothetical protein
MVWRSRPEHPVFCLLLPPPRHAVRMSFLGLGYQGPHPNRLVPVALLLHRRRCALRRTLESVLLSPARLPFRHSRDGRNLISADGGGGAGSERNETRFRAAGSTQPGARRRSTVLRQSAVRALKAAVGPADARGMGFS